MSALYAIGCWMFGLAWIGVQSALAGAERVWVVRLAQGLFVLGIAVLVGATDVIVAASNGAAAPSPGPSRSGVWFYALGCALPALLFATLASRRLFGRQLLTVLATIPAAAFLVASGAAFRATGQPITGFAGTVHDHHALAVAALALSVVLPAASLVPARRTSVADYAAASGRTSSSGV